MKNIKYYSLFLIAFLFSMASCTKDDHPEAPNKTAIEIQTKDKDTNKVSFAQAELLARDIFDDDIESITPVGSNEQSPSFYIINYKTSHFLILAGDKRSYPVLAHSSESNFDVKTEEYPEGLVDWLITQDSTMLAMSTDTLIDRSESYKLWNKSEIKNFVLKTTNASVPCNSQLQQPVLIESNGPLLTSTWGQGVGYNNLAPNYGCSQYSNGRTATGCVATAMSQVIRYYQHPGTYDWSAMPNATWTSSPNEISRLMRDAGNSVGMDWGCASSGAETSSVPSALKTSFDYDSANYSGFNSNTALNEIMDGYPLIVRGGKKVKVWLFFNVYKNGHAWVCDGIEHYKIRVKHPVGRFGWDYTCFSRYAYHMNWGWNGTYNGWYTSWENPAGTFNYKTAMVYNIRK